MMARSDDVGTRLGPGGQVGRKGQEILCLGGRDLLLPEVSSTEPTADQALRLIAGQVPLLELLDAARLLVKEPTYSEIRHLDVGCEDEATQKGDPNEEH